MIQWILSHLLLIYLVSIPIVIFITLFIYEYNRSQDKEMADSVITAIALGALWPLVLAIIIITGPFYGISKLARYIKEQSDERKLQQGEWKEERERLASREMAESMGFTIVSSDEEELTPDIYDDIVERGNPMERYGVFVRIDVDAESKEAAIEVAEEVLSTISKPERFKGWHHYEVEEA